LLVNYDDDTAAFIRDAHEFIEYAEKTKTIYDLDKLIIDLNTSLNAALNITDAADPVIIAKATTANDTAVSAIWTVMVSINKLQNLSIKLSINLSILDKKLHQYNLGGSAESDVPAMHELINILDLSNKLELDLIDKIQADADAAKAKAAKAKTANADILAIVTTVGEKAMFAYRGISVAMIILWDMGVNISVLAKSLYRCILGVSTAESDAAESDAAKVDALIKASGSGFKAGITHANAIGNLEVTLKSGKKYMSDAWDVIYMILGGVKDNNGLIDKAKSAIVAARSHDPVSPCIVEFILYAEKFIITAHDAFTFSKVRDLIHAADIILADALNTTAADAPSVLAIATNATDKVLNAIHVIATAVISLKEHNLKFGNLANNVAQIVPGVIGFSEILKILNNANRR